MAHLSSETYACEDCGRQYAYEWHLSSHRRECASSKRTLSDLLDQTKEFWESRKRRRLELQEARAPSPQHPVVIAQADDPSIHEPIATRRQGRQAGLPARYRQSVSPKPTSSRREVPANVASNTPPARDTENVLAQPSPLYGAVGDPTVSFKSSERDLFGVMKSFSVFKRSDSNDPSDQALTPSEQTDALCPSPYGPFPNKTSFALADWYWNSNNKSIRDFRKLIGIFKHSEFSAEDAASANWNVIFKELGANKQDLPEDRGSWITDDGWLTAAVHIDIPFHNYTKAKGTEPYLAGQLHYRSIVSVIRECLLDPTKAPHLQFHPYQATWRPTEDYPEVPLYGELYTSPEFQKAYDTVQRLPQTERNFGLERVVIGLMFASDATHLTDFGTASLWPCYMFLGNESKYQRCRPNEHSGHHIAYFESLSDGILDYLHKRNDGRLPTDTAETIVTYCHREVFHRQWSLLIEGELMDAMLNGLVITCLDGKRRCFYPRIMTYSADYPEKCLIACTRRLGSRPCHRCLVKKTKDAQSTLGSPADTERLELLQYEQRQNASIDAALQDISNGYAINSKAVEQKLFPESLQPTKSAFAPLLSELNFSINTALVVDALHEFEIGFWKRVIIHLIRLLVAAQDQASPINLKDELDRRYRLTPAFGRDTIRKFNSNTSAMKRKTARDFENVLQCAIPAFTSLLPGEHDANLLKLLYICAEWHALAKLRMHNDFTVRLLEYTTTLLGSQVRAFHQKTCSVFDTRELEKEANARRKRAANGKSGGQAAKKVSFDVYTIKFHFLGDYASTIRQFGTTDSYSTETGELSHCLPKSWYPRTNKRSFRTQMSQIERRQARLAQISQTLGEGHSNEELKDLDDNDSPELPFMIAANQNDPVYLLDLLPRADIDLHQSLFLKDFILKLKQHLLPRVIRKLGFDVDDRHNWDWAYVSLKDDRLFQHRLMRINFEMYDTHKGKDIIHIESSSRSIMLLNPRYTATTQKTEHPYRYYDVLGILHANVSFVGVLPDGSRCYKEHRLEFLWVRRYNLEPSVPFRLDRVQLCPLDEPEALEFLDPVHVLRAVHLIPCFEKGLSQESEKRPWQKRSQPEQIWNAYHINKFADRDMYMRFQWGMSVGHRYMYPGFPPPCIPTVGPDFDHCLLAKPQNVTMPLNSQPVPAAAENVAADSRALQTSQSGELNGDREQGRAAGAADAVGPDGEGDDDEEEDDEGEDAEEGDAEEEENGHDNALDGLSDRELAVYNEMYGPSSHIL